MTLPLIYTMQWQACQNKMAQAKFKKVQHEQKESKVIAFANLMVDWIMQYINV